MKVHKHSSTSVINREALELRTKRSLKLQLVNSTSSEPRPPTSPPAVVSVISTELGETSTELGADCHPIKKTWPLPGAGQDDDNMQKSPLMGSLREKEGRILVLKCITFI